MWATPPPPVQPTTTVGEDSFATTSAVEPTVWVPVTANLGTTVTPQPANVTSSHRALACSTTTAPTTIDVAVANVVPPAPTTATVGTNTTARTVRASQPPPKRAPKTPTVEEV